MKVFFDTNVILDVLLDRHPFPGPPSSATFRGLEALQARDECHRVRPHQGRGTRPEEHAKRDIARGLLDQKDNVLSVQVLQEFYVRSTRASRREPISHDVARGLIQTWLRFPVQHITVDLLGLALDLMARHAWSYWDSAIVAASLMTGCTELMTEDLQDGQRISGTTIVNPFSIT